jgi:hypothetical protein
VAKPKYFVEVSGSPEHLILELDGIRATNQVIRELTQAGIPHQAEVEFYGDEDLEPDPDWEPDDFDKDGTEDFEFSEQLALADDQSDGNWLIHPRRYDEEEP